MSNDYNPDCGTCMAKKPNAFEHFFTSLRTKFNNIKMYLKLRFALGFLNWLYSEKEDGFVNYFENEWLLRIKNINTKTEKKYYKEKEDSYKLILRMSDFFDRTIGIGKFFLNKVFDFRPLSSLTLKDDEFYNITNIGGMQNCRRSSVFKDSKGNVYDIDAISWVTVKRLNIAEDGKQHKLELYPYNSGHHGCVIGYDFKNEKWIPLSSGQKIIPNNDYEANHYFNVNCIELYDSTDKHNDFFAYIIDIDDIPEEFYHYFILDDCRNYGDRKSSFEEEIAYLEKHQMQNLLIKSDKLDFNDLITECIVDNDSLTVKILFGSRRYAMLLMKELSDAGVSYNDMRYIYTDDNIIIFNYSSNKETIEKVISISKKIQKKEQ